VTLGGLLKHLAYMEDLNFTRVLDRAELPGPWNTVDWNADEGWEWRSALDDTPEELHSLWRESVARSRSAVAKDGGAGDGRVGHCGSFELSGPVVHGRTRTVLARNVQHSTEQCKNSTNECRTVDC